jgi:hypothetical protein
MKTTNEISEKAQSRPEQSATANKQQLPSIDFVLRRSNCALSMSRLLALLRKEKPEFYQLAEVVGRHVWISFGSKQAVSVTTALSQLGFHWNGEFQAWIHRCGWLDRRMMRHPRARFGSYFPADFFRA